MGGLVGSAPPTSDLEAEAAANAFINIDEKHENWALDVWFFPRILSPRTVHGPGPTEVSWYFFSCCLS